MNTQSNISKTFDFYGFSVKINAPNDIIDFINTVFSDYPSQKNKSNYSNVIVLNSIFNFKNKYKKILKLKEYTIFYHKGLRIINYNDKLLCICNFKKNRFTFISPSLKLLKEKLYLFLISQIGEYLDSKKIHRIHASSIEINKKTFIISGDIKAGKTTALLKLYSKHNFSKVISDDVTFIDHKFNIYRISKKISVDQNIINNFNIETTDYSLFEKKLILPQHIRWSEKILLPHKLLFIILSRKNKLNIYYQLFLYLVIGYGTPQMIEFFIRFNLRHLIKLMLIFFKRTILYLKLMHKYRKYILEIIYNNYSEIEKDLDKIFSKLP